MKQKHLDIIIIVLTLFIFPLYMLGIWGVGFDAADESWTYLHRSVASIPYVIVYFLYLFIIMMLSAIRIQRNSRTSQLLMYAYITTLAIHALSQMSQQLLELHALSRGRFAISYYTTGGIVPFIVFVLFIGLPIILVILSILMTVTNTQNQSAIK
ncbi:hypothetical protein [Erysipelothrix anatis]|uniref:hypothetical protein n=1 Tax=Erysipelothrix anatis TaxID=2683713 RepID=UPI0013597938|nr:hypothetical protein [Erysipelothrix anatis]